MRDTDTILCPATALLKDATTAAHRDVEAQPLMAALMADTVSADIYCRVLDAFAAYHALWEPAIFKALSPHTNAAFLAVREKHPLVSADLAGMNRPAPRPHPAGPLGLGDALGRFYVQEGATLGGRVISKHLARALPTALVKHTTYFNGYGPRTAAMWAESRQVIDNLCTDEDVRQAAVAGAQDAFAALKVCIQAA